ncbi:NAD-dependent formate dehydrogenase beta subunit, partial [Burkholderia multivorans CGD1]
MRGGNASGGVPASRWVSCGAVRFAEVSYAAPAASVARRIVRAYRDVARGRFGEHPVAHVGDFAARRRIVLVEPVAVCIGPRADARAEHREPAVRQHRRDQREAYVCGEETALLESLEGKRGVVRAKPPLPALAGLFGQPTVINNVITLATAPVIFARGAAFYRDYGMGRSRGTLPFQLAGNIRYGGLVELAFGVTLRELLFDFGGGTATGRPARAAQVGGPLGTYLPEHQWDVPLDYEAYTAIGAVVGHGGIVLHDDTSNLAELAEYAMKFCAIESCGKCT